MSVFNKLTEGIVKRDMKKEGQALLSKWEKTGLLEGLRDDNQKNGMARLLENQAKELLREAASQMAGGDVQGFSAVAFPIVRRVFGGLIANDLVSVQPMSLPSGLIFFLDFTYGNSRVGGTGDVVGAANEAGTSIYGGGVVGSALTGGVNLSSGSNAERGFYSLNTGYSSPTGTIAPVLLANTIAGTGSYADFPTLNKLIRFDPDLSGSGVVCAKMTGSSDDNFANFDVANLMSLNLTGALGNGRLVRRLTQFHTASTDNMDPSDTSNFSLLLVFEATSAAVTQRLAEEVTQADGSKHWSWLCSQG
jgi:hypothetical protein